FGEDAAERPDLKVGLRRGVGCLVGRAARGGPRVRGVGGDGQAQAVAVLAADEVGDGAGGGVGGGGVGVVDGDVDVPGLGLGLRLVGHAAQQLRGVDRADVPCLTHAAEVLVALLADHDVVLQGEHGVGGFAED